MDKKLPQFFDTIPKNPYEVHALPSYQERNLLMLFISYGNRLSSRLRCLLNTYSTRGRHNAEFLRTMKRTGSSSSNFDSTELENLPSFRKHSSETAYVELGFVY